MKMISSFNTLRAAVLSLLLIVACSPDSVIPVPDDDAGRPAPPDSGQSVSVALLKTLYKGAPLLITGEYRISGVVVSSDNQGNFYKTLVVEDDTGGIEVKIDMEDIFKRFNIFSRVTVRCNGLWLGSYGGTLQLGAEPFGDYQTQYLDEASAAEYIVADREFYGEVLPRELSFTELDPRRISTFVSFDDVRFIDQELGLSWADTEDGADGEAPAAATDRHLVDAAGDTLVVRTSRYARFATKTLPEGRGRIEGVMGYFNGEYRLVVCDAEKFFN